MMKQNDIYFHISNNDEPNKISRYFKRVSIFTYMKGTKFDCLLIYK
jgi:hypothetical protein